MICLRPFVPRGVTAFTAVSLIVIVMTVVPFGRFVAFLLVMMMTSLVLLLRAVMTLK